MLDKIITAQKTLTVSHFFAKIRGLMQKHLRFEVFLLELSAFLNEKQKGWKKIVMSQLKQTTPKP